MNFTFKLYRQQRGGVWENLGDFATKDEAVAAAIEWAKNTDTFLDDFGTAVFGISGPAGGHDETRVEVYEDGQNTVQNY